MTTINKLENWCDDYLRAGEFKDYCPNGLQVDASINGQIIDKVVTGVTACQALIDEAIKRKAQVILVHHGYFWKGEPAALIGMKGKRVKSLMQNNLSLIAYHLPLDAHPIVGNNAQLAKLLSLTNSAPLYPHEKHPVGNIYEVANGQAMSADELLQLLQQQLHSHITHIKGHNGAISKIAICSGGAQDMIDQAVAMGCHAYISGEISERTTHTAREMGIDYFACGHHATERAGVKALGELIAKELNLDVEFVDIDNPA